MIYFKVKNNTNRNISKIFKSAVNKLRPYFYLIPKDKYPLAIIVEPKKFQKDRSNWNNEEHKMTLHIYEDEKKQSDSDIEWVICHEFAHVVQSYNPEIAKASHHREDGALRKLFMKLFDMNENQVEEIFHDFFPTEVFGNSFASMLTNHFYKRHGYDIPQKYLIQMGVMAENVQTCDNCGDKRNIQAVGISKSGKTVYLCSRCNNFNVKQRLGVIDKINNIRRSI